jgi:hypothetical protein
LKLGCVWEPTDTDCLSFDPAVRWDATTPSPNETLINNIQNYNVYVLSAINGLQETTVLGELCISELFFVLRI